MSCHSRCRYKFGNCRRNHFRWSVVCMQSSSLNWYFSSWPEGEGPSSRKTLPWIQIAERGSKFEKQFFKTFLSEKYQLKRKCSPKKFINFVREVLTLWHRLLTYMSYCFEFSFIVHDKHCSNLTIHCRSPSLRCLPLITSRKGLLWCFVRA